MIHNYSRDVIAAIVCLVDKCTYAISHATNTTIQQKLMSNGVFLIFCFFPKETTLHPRQDKL